MWSRSLAFASLRLPVCFNCLFFYFPSLSHSLVVSRMWHPTRVNPRPPGRAPTLAHLRPCELVVAIGAWTPRGQR